jgi:prepilin-type N-terminal cleavage/methylation domain-containing protein
MRRQKGFTLIELLITVAIILIVAAIAIPNLIRSRLAANESSAVATLHAVNASEAMYSSTFGVGYSGALADLGGTCSLAIIPTTSAACLIDSVIAADPATKSGYTFAYVGAAGATYTLTGSPLVRGSTGQRYFFTDQTNVIRADLATSATSTSSPI